MELIVDIDLPTSFVSSALNQIHGPLSKTRKLTKMPSKTASNDFYPLEDLSQIISKNASIVSQYLGDHNLPQPSFESDGPSVIVPSSAPQSVQKARQSLIASCLELLQLAIGPTEYLPNLAIGVSSSDMPFLSI